MNYKGRARVAGKRIKLRIRRGFREGAYEVECATCNTSGPICFCNGERLMRCGDRRRIGSAREQMTDAALAQPPAMR